MSSSAPEGQESVSEEEGTRYLELFEKLDVNKDGKVDIEDLSRSLREMESFEKHSWDQVQDHAKKIFDRTDLDKDGHITFKEFVRYLSEHEKELKLAFHKLDENRDGVIDSHEIQASFRKLGIHIDREEAMKLLHRMDKDKTLKINWDEWRDYLTFHPNSDLHDIVHYWRHGVIPMDMHGGWWRHLMAGGAAGMVSRSITAPIDRLKILLQVYSTNQNKLGVYSGFKQLYREGGARGLWRGNGINVLKIAPESAIKFMAYEQIKRSFKDPYSGEIAPVHRFISGSLAGAVAQTIIYPMEVIKTRLALGRTGEYSGIVDCVSKVVKHDGGMSLYRGYLPNLVGILPYAGIDLFIYETLKSKHKAWYPDHQDPSIIFLLFCGATSCSFGQLCTYPLALIRTKLQAKGKLGGKKDSWIGLGRTIVKEEGFLGLYRGIIPNFAKVLPAVSISYVTYEHVRKLLGVDMS
ncbi:calcium-binding mitochondrial carrier protein SCaMC-1-A isoform X2 [Lingula anatina]|uniref:Calcium-binding mitochondrial carrier protein SCaMC-1-A isoform X2 n=1 Tax=Lingula anatina TaxID=7574 RepID=A0A1S3I7G3_LINAN|nr:calcium-binding mitochondrial carrier protein SCaMC-1-A isoform X2 [Lingula anatina]|eukprot:XP_013394192.1 calcium-binding mitochondrial carrier protein SCaMC-1-A isoform X2 [Lingula anatina]